jgi:hypothetical protein
MRSKWLVYCLNTLILIILIQQPEPSGSETGLLYVNKVVSYELVSDDFKVTSLSPFFLRSVFGRYPIDAFSTQNGSVTPEWHGA